MSDITYVFDLNTLTLYNMFCDQPLEVLLGGSYKDIINNFSQQQINQYNF